MRLLQAGGNGRHHPRRWPNAIVLCPIICGIMGGIGAAIAAAIYNLASGWVGGVELDIG
ncbi:MAG: hypothetical protein LAN64_05185 [Acidobacteriia bacterium]|nr:hypothetical protein [Terriglobia bacterium]